MRGGCSCAVRRREWRVLQMDVDHRNVPVYLFQDVHRLALQVDGQTFPNQGSDLAQIGAAGDEAL
jgi:hypothetical protein